MQSRWSAAGGVLACFLLLALAPGAGAVDYHIASDGSGDYLTLDDLRKDIDNGVKTLRGGDSIILHNHDRSLTAPIVVSSDAAVTLRSQGGVYSVFPANPQHPHEIIKYGTTTGGANLTIKNLIVRNAASPVSINPPGPERGQVVISNSHFEDNSGSGVQTTGNMDITITNTSFKNTDALQINTAAGDKVTLQINVDSNAVGRTVTWDGRSTGIEFKGAGSADMTVDVAAGKKLDIRDDVFTNLNQVDFVKEGAGTLRLGGGWVGGNQISSDTNFDIKAGTLHLGGRTVVTEGTITGDVITGNTMTIHSGAVFKPSVTVGNLEEGLGQTGEMEWTTETSLMRLGSFTAQPGARLEIGNVSTFPQFSLVTSTTSSSLRAATTVAVLAGNPSLTVISPGTMEINNALMRAKLYRGDSANVLNEEPEADAINAIILRIYDIQNLDTLAGVGSYADVYRRLPNLSDGERDMLDSIYASGGVGDSALGYLQTLGGAVVMNASVAMRHNWAGVLRAISKRSTVFQKEELEPEITGSDYVYEGSIPTVDYGAVWAYIDKSWTGQDDLGNIAGYRYNPYGVGIGYEWHKDEWVYGGVLRYDSGDMELKSNPDTKTEVQSLIGSLYASWASDGYYATGGLHLGHGWNESTSAYNAAWEDGLAVTGSYGSSLYGASLEIGRMMHLDLGGGDYPVRVTPYAGLAYARISRAAVTESGAGTLNKHFRQSVWGMWEYNAGVRVALPLEYFDFTLIPSVDASLVRTMGTPDDVDGDAYLLTNPGRGWRVPAWDSNRTALRLNGSVNARFRNNLDVGVSYDFEWRKKAWNHQLSMNMSLGF